MQRLEVNQGEEGRWVLSQMIVSKAVLQAVAAVWERPGLFPAPWANQVGTILVKFFHKYAAAPGARRAEVLLQRACEHQQLSNEDNVGLVEIMRLCNEGSPSVEDLPWVLTRCQEYFSLATAAARVAKLEAAIDSGDAGEATKWMTTPPPTLLGAHNSTVDLFGMSFEQFASIFDVSEEDLTLVSPPGALGEFFGQDLGRGKFVSILAPEKRGKSFWLHDLACRAVRERSRVFFFELGDMTEKQFVRRFSARLSGAPLRLRAGVQVPQSIVFEDGVPKVAYETRDFTTLSSQRAWKAMQEQQKRLKSDTTYFRYHCSPPSTFTVADIRRAVEASVMRGWRPDVVVLDYADLLAFSGSFRERHDAVRQVWADLRALSMDLNCLVLTATQANAASYKAPVLGPQHFSDSKAKLAYVTSMFGVNRARQAAGLYFLNWIVRRDDEGDSGSGSHCYVASALSLARPAVVSAWPPREDHAA